ncbi:MAG: thiamine pyrophosphate-dependent enzyme [Oscillospiraceae bacterium]|nr:thiamine pyrophosphate-dependent enzyme [Oscillospiraceae bacterium]
MEKRLMLGNEAVARGLYEAGCSFVSSYPGTPSSEITKYASEHIYAEWAPNEKVSVEASVGASFAGARAFSAMKHVGLNVAADPLFTASYTGVGGGLVIAVADDMGCHPSQNEQDSRHYALSMKLPMLEPCDSQECLDYTRLAFELSEQYDTPVLLRLSTRVSHSRSVAAEGKPKPYDLKDYVKDARKWVMTPANARPAHVKVEKRMLALGEACETTPLNTVIRGTENKIGVISAGHAYLTAREALGDKASYFKLGMIYPLPVGPIAEFAKTVDELWVIEELDDFIETHCRKHGFKVRGKADLSPLGEYTAQQLRDAILAPCCACSCETTHESGQNTTNQPQPTPDIHSGLCPPPPRPPVLCPGCPHWGSFAAIKKLGLTVMGDIGCYTLGASPPLSAIDFCLCMGASVSGLHGVLKARPEFAKSTVAVIGDSTFWHSGITGLLNIVYNQTPATVLILDNATTAMTGHQPSPGTGETLMGQKAPAADLETVCRGLGVQSVATVDPRDQKALEAALTEALAADEPSVIICRRSCVIQEVWR